MAGYKGHMVGAGLMAGCYFAFLQLVFSINLLAYHGARLHGWAYVGALFVIAVLFGLWPDVDTNSKAQNVFSTLVFSSDLYLIATKRLEAAAYLGLIALLPILGKHRGWTHSFWAMLVVPLPIIVGPYLRSPNTWRWALVYYGAAVVGYFSHLFFDGRVTRFIKAHEHGHD